MLSLGATLALIGTMVVALIAAEAMLTSIDRRMRRPQKQAAADG